MHWQPVSRTLLALLTVGHRAHVKAHLSSMLGNIQTAAAGLSDVASQPMTAAILNTILAMRSAPDAHDSSEMRDFFVNASWTKACASGQSSLCMHIYARLPGHLLCVCAPLLTILFTSTVTPQPQLMQPYW